jgi:hypothetical protein
MDFENACGCTDSVLALGSVQPETNESSLRVHRSKRFLEICNGVRQPTRPVPQCRGLVSQHPSQSLMRAPVFTDSRESLETFPGGIDSSVREISA